MALLSTIQGLVSAPVEKTQQKSAEKAAQKSDEAFNIPVVDFGKFHDGTPEERMKIAQEIIGAMRDAGFMYIKNHPIPEQMIDSVFGEASDFFELPMDVKDSLAWTDARANRGYIQQGRERVTNDYDNLEEQRESAPDVKETMEIGNEENKEFANRWPPQDKSPKFKPTMVEFWDSCHNLYLELLSAIAIGLNLPEDFFVSINSDRWNTLRLLNYPPTDRKVLEKGGSNRAGAHSDYGSLTLLFQDAVGGLEVENPDTKHFIPATPIPGTIVVNTGDLMARWSNDLFRSTVHRVVMPPVGSKENPDVTPRRQSVAYFCAPNTDAVVECIPTCAGPEGPKYGPVTTVDFIVSRLSSVQ